MMKMVHAVTGVEMWVSDDRVRDYLMRGHYPAPLPKPEKATPAEMEAVKKRVRKSNGSIRNSK